MNPIRKSTRRPATMVGVIVLLTMAFIAIVSFTTAKPSYAWYIQPSCTAEGAWNLHNPEGEPATIMDGDNKVIGTIPAGGDMLVSDSIDVVTATWPSDQYPRTYNRPEDCKPTPPTEPTTPPAAPNATVTYECVEIEGQAAGLLELVIGNVSADTAFNFAIPQIGITIDGVGPSFSQYVLPFEAGTYAYVVTIGETVINGTFGASDCTPSTVEATFDTECVDGNANGVAMIDVTGPDPEEEFLFYVGPEATPIAWADQTASIGFTAGEPGDEVILRLTLGGETVAMATVEFPQCGPVPTEPTTPSTPSTTSTSTTSTTPPPTSSTTSTTSTTAPSTTSSSTTSSTQPATTSSTAAPPTSVEQQTPTTPSTTVPTGTLPRTGGSSDTAATIALIVLAGGIALLIVASRRFQQQHLS